MTSEPTAAAEAPRGFRYELVNKQLVVVCPTCKRRWRADRIAIPENRTWLADHRDQHHHELEIAKFLLHSPPDD